MVDMEMLVVTGARLAGFLRSKKAISERFVKIWPWQLRGNEFWAKNLGHLNSLLLQKCTHDIWVKSSILEINDIKLE